LTSLALKSLWARKVRALTTTFAVVIGVAFMAGSYVLTDTIFAAFDDPDAAISCACAIQASLQRQQAEHGYAPSVRIGVHADEVTDRGGDLAGRGVHLAARVMAAAEGGEVLVTSSTLGEASGSFEIAEEREIDAKGVGAPLSVARIGWARAA